MSPVWLRPPNDIISCNPVVQQAVISTCYILIVRLLLTNKFKTSQMQVYYSHKICCQQTFFSDNFTSATTNLGLHQSPAPATARIRRFFPNPALGKFLPELDVKNVQK